MQRCFEKILLVKPSSLGDVVHALPVLHGLRTRFPAATIDWLIASPFASLLRGHPEVDNLILFDRQRFGFVGRSLSATAAFCAFVHDLRSRRYDLVIDLQGLFRTGFLTLATGARVRIGFADAGEGAWVFYTHRLPRVDRDMHAVDRYYRVGGLLGFEKTPIEFRLALSGSAQSEAETLLDDNGLPGGVPYVVIVPGARWETKVWLPERFVETVDTIQGRDGVRCVVVGGPGEVDLCARIVRGCASTPINLAGKTTIPQLAAVLARAAVVLCHDSAAMHLAVALERPVVCLIGPTNPRRTGPYRRPGDVVQRMVECSPCYLRRLSQCPHDHRCMKELTTGEVVQAIRQALDGQAAAHWSRSPTMRVVVGERADIP